MAISYNLSASELEGFRMHDGALEGPVRTPRNSARSAGAGSIHDDATAKKLGFRGGTVAGSLHMEQFPPLLTTIFGQRWFETGGLSLYFRYATSDEEQVQAFAKTPPSDLREASDGQPASGQIDVWMDDMDGHRICDGTASVGTPTEPSALANRLKATPEPEDIRILEALEPGHEGEPVKVRASKERLDARLNVITEPMVEYTDASTYGAPALPPSMMVQTIRVAEQGLLKRNSNFGVGLFGAIEVQALKGPVFVEKDYEARGRILAVSETPKTEYFWYESILADPERGEDVARMMMMLRFMKASSDLWK